MNIRLNRILLAGLVLGAGLSSCTNSQTPGSGSADSLEAYVAERLPIYAKVRLTTDIENLTDNERQVLPLLIKAAQVMDDLFWDQVYPQRDSLLATITDDKTKQFLLINYGPWDRLNNNKPFVNGVGEKPAGSGFYPPGMTKEELESSDVEDKKGLYSMIRRDSTGNLYAIPYHIFFKERLEEASGLLKQAAALTDEPQLKKYLGLRAEALVTDNYTPSDYAWMDMTDNGLDIIIGPIENYEDALFNARAAYESYVLVKDKEWSKRLEKYVSCRLMRHIKASSRVPIPSLRHLMWFIMLVTAIQVGRP
jgi:hypothetical protein